MSFKVICVDAKNKPSEFTDTWLIENNEYTIIKASLLMEGVIGVKVEEIEISENNPYQYFNVNRFGIPEEIIEEFGTFIKDQVKQQEKDNTDLGLDEFLKVDKIVEEV